jgi:hypothetical protein
MTLGSTALARGRMRGLEGQWFGLAKARLCGAVIPLALLAICAALYPGEAEAKHPIPSDPQASEIADAAPAPTQSGKATVIHGEIDETHDRLPPDELLGIERAHIFTITLSGKNQVSETWTGARLDNGPRPVGMHRHAGGGSKYSESSSTIGDNTGRVVWHVLGEKKLQRIFAGQQFLLMMNIEIGPDNACHLDAKYLQQQGFTFIIHERADNGELAHFSLSRVVKATCTIE